MNNVHLIPTVNNQRIAKAKSKVTIKREQGVNTIKKIAEAEDLSPITVAERVLSQSIPELSSYVQGKGIVPSDDYSKLALQAALLRMVDIGQTARILKKSDKDALLELEEAETDSFVSGQSENDNVLSPTVQASLLILTDKIRKGTKKKTVTDFVRNLPSNYNINNLLQNDAFTGGSTGTTANNGGSDVQGWINTAIDLYNVIFGKKSGGSDPLGGAVTDYGSDIGKETLNKWFKENGLIIAGSILAIILLIFLIVRYGRK